MGLTSPADNLSFSYMWILTRKNWMGIVEFVALKNPIETTEDVREARLFVTKALAAGVKRGLHIERGFSPRRAPDWLV